jgi:hypothetical protein
MEKLMLKEPASVLRKSGHHMLVFVGSKQHSGRRTVLPKVT